MIFPAKSRWRSAETTRFCLLWLTDAGRVGSAGGRRLSPSTKSGEHGHAWCSIGEGRNDTRRGDRGGTRRCDRRRHPRCAGIVSPRCCCRARLQHDQPPALGPTADMVLGLLLGRRRVRVLVRRAGVGKAAGVGNGEFPFWSAAGCARGPQPTPKQNAWVGDTIRRGSKVRRRSGIDLNVMSLPRGSGPTGNDMMVLGWAKRRD